MTGIKERHWADEDQDTSDLAYNASIKAIEDAGILPEDIDMIIVATATGDMPFPSVANILQEIRNWKGSHNGSTRCMFWIYVFNDYS